MMKKLSFVALLAVAAMTVSAQDNTYIVKTKGVKKPVEKAVVSAASNAQEDAGPQDFLGKNFRYYSMCDWQDGMRFMVIPEKYDLLVNTFHDANGKEVSSAALRHHIMVYRGHQDMPNGRVHVLFFSETDNRNYYFELPSGTFDNYCYGKLGVPTLAYLGDVDKARELLMNQKLLTRTQHFCEDTEYDGDGFREVTMPKNKVVTVVAVGVGTRSFPVKIIVEDENGEQFFQNVAMSKTNSGMRDSDFDVDNAKHFFPGSFEYTGGDMVVSSNLSDYLNQTVHTKLRTTMSSRGSGKVREVKVPPFTGFIIDDIRPVKNSNFCTLTLRETETRRVYTKDITFSEETALEDGNKDDYFGTLFGMGDGESRSTTLETRAAIREGRVIPGMSEEEVELAVGEPYDTQTNTLGIKEWYYKRSNDVTLIVEFDSDGIVKNVVTKAGAKTRKIGGIAGGSMNTRRAAAMSSNSGRLLGNGTSSRMK